MYGNISFSCWKEVTRKDLVEYGFTNDLEVVRATRNMKSTIAWCIEKELLPPEKFCHTCRTYKKMRLQRYSSGSVEGLSYRCLNVKCNSRVSMRHGTLLDCASITSMEIIKIIFHYFVRGFNATQAFNEIREIMQIDRVGFDQEKEDYEYTLGSSVVRRIYSLVRKSVHNFMQNQFRRNKLGKHGHAIEIDESIFSTVYKEGKKEKIWVLGFYERGTKEARAFQIKDRSEETLTQIILENVEVGAEIYTDFWRGYNGLKQFYVHRVVNKAQKGSGTSEYQTTNRVESLWSTIKRTFQVYSAFNSPYMQMFLDEAIWRRKYKRNEERVEFLC